MQTLSYIANANPKKEQFKQYFEESQDNYSQVDIPNAQNQNVGRPIQLIKIRHNGKIQINNQALEIIANANEPVGFVSLVGKTRTGKSCLLNRLLSISGDGFRVDSSTSSCTEGIWMWSVPFRNNKYNNLIFFLDTEGTDSLVKDPQNDIKIFTMAVLISSYFIYNSLGSIDERSISDIQMVTALSKKIKMGEDASSSDPAQLARFMPKFMWVLRDFMLKLEDEKGRRITSNVYLQNCLTDQNSIVKSNQTSRRIKKSIVTYFPMRQCITLVRPVDEEQVMYDLNKLSDSRLRHQFVEGVNLLRAKIIDNTGPKVYAGKQITGYNMSVMIQNYVEAFNAGGVPNIKSAWEQIAQDEGTEAYNHALDVYTNLLDREFPEERPCGEQIYKKLGKLRTETLNDFKQQVGNNLREHADQQARLQQLIDQREKEILRVNEELCTQHNNDLISKYSLTMKKRIENQHYLTAEGKNDLKKDIEDVQSNYLREAKGKNSGVVLTEFLTLMTPILLNMKNKDNGSEQAELQRQKQLAEMYKKQADLQKEKNKSLQNQQEVNKRTQQLKTGSKLPPKDPKDARREKKEQQGCCSGGCYIM